MVPILGIMTGFQGEAVSLRVELVGPAEGGTVEVFAVRGAEIVVANPVDSNVFQIDIEEPDPWSLTCEGDGLWCPEVEVEEQESTYRLPVFASRRARLELSSQPSSLRMQVAAYDGGRTLTSTQSVEIPSRSLELPRVEKLDLRFTAPGYGPVYVYGLGPGDPLPPLNLVPGASLSGFLLDAESLRPIDGEVHLGPPEPMAGLQVEERRRLDRRRLRLEVGERGFFQARGLAAGEYRLRATAEGYSPRDLHIDVGAGAETHLGQDLRLSPLEDVSWTLLPAVHPAGEAWELTLLQPDGSEVVRRLPETGQVELQLPAGIHQVSIHGAGQRYVFQPIAVGDGGEIHLDLDLAEVRGQVARGDEAVPAELFLRTGKGAEITLETDLEGYFEGWVPVPPTGETLVQVKSRSPTRDQYVKGVFEPVSGKGWTRLLVELPAHRVKGGVVDALGRGVRGARVVLFDRSNQTAQTTTGPWGDFEVDVDPSASYWVHAFHVDHGKSALVPLDTEEGRTVLELSDPSTAVLRLVGGGGQGVVGARVTARSVPSFSTDSGTSGLDGSAKIRVPKNTRAASTTVFASGRPMWGGCVPLTPGGPPIELELPDEGGTLSIQGEDGGEPWVLVSAAGGVWSPSSLVSWRLRQGLDAGTASEALVVPAMAPGLYGVLPARAPLWELAKAACEVQPRVSWQVLAPGGFLNLVLEN
ncbi:MAG: carboxypeptidase-like regulatory domain-containing protein [Acidobacteriota bacterium]